MKIGVVLPLSDEHLGRGPSYRDIRGFAVNAESAGFDSVWVYDHLLFRFPDQPPEGIHEAWTILAAVADATSRVELGTIVLCSPFRNPALLAKMATTLDEVSEGRLILGLGAGWHEPEFEAFGYPFDHRVSRFEEALQIIVPLLREGRVDFRGKYHSAPDCEVLPRPSRPDLPILVAGKQPRMRALAARYGDATNIAWLGHADQVAERWDPIAETCREQGRNPETLELTVGVRVTFPELGGEFDEEYLSRSLHGSPAHIAAEFAAFEWTGARHLICAVEPGAIPSLQPLAAALAIYRQGAAETAD